MGNNRLFGICYLIEKFKFWLNGTICHGYVQLAFVAHKQTRTKKFHRCQKAYDWFGSSAAMSYTFDHKVYKILILYLHQGGKMEEQRFMWRQPDLHMEQHFVTMILLLLLMLSIIFLVITNDSPP